MHRILLIILILLIEIGAASFSNENKFIPFLYAGQSHKSDYSKNRKPTLRHKGLLTSLVPLSHVNTESGKFIDLKGRERYFRGQNVIYKSHPWIPPFHKNKRDWNVDTSFGPLDAAIMSHLGWNVIRLGVMWPGVETQPGQYNETYLDQVEQVLDVAEFFGISVLLDMHTDILSELFCGQGIPTFYTKPDSSFPLPLALPFHIGSNSSSPYIPSPEQCLSRPWYSFYGTAAVASGYTALYTNWNNTRDALGQYFVKVLERFGNGKKAGNIGVDMMNEPWSGWNVIFPTKTDHDLLQPFYRALSKTIFESDHQTILHFESVAYDQKRIGFDTAPFGNDYINRTALSYHYYKPPQFSSASVSIGSRVSEMKRLGGIGGILSEFEGNKRSYVTGKDRSKELFSILDSCDNFAQGWIAWEYKPFIRITGWEPSIFVNGKWDEANAKNLARTYLQAVAGTLLSMVFDRNNGYFKAQIRLDDTTIREATEIRMQPNYFFSDYQIVLTPENWATYEICDVPDLASLPKKWRADDEESFKDEHYRQKVMSEPFAYDQFKSKAEGGVVILIQATSKARRNQVVGIEIKAA